MTELTLEEAKPRLKELLDRAATGDVVAIRNDSGVRILLTAEHKEADADECKPKPNRVFGQWKGMFELGPEFFEPLSHEELALFEDGPVFPDEEQADVPSRVQAK